VGVGLLANAVCQMAERWLIHRLREQARSHSGTVLASDFDQGPQLSLQLLRISQVQFDQAP